MGTEAEGTHAVCHISMYLSSGYLIFLFKSNGYICNRYSCGGTSAMGTSVGVLME